MEQSRTEQNGTPHYFIIVFLLQAAHAIAFSHPKCICHASCSGNANQLKLMSWTLHEDPTKDNCFVGHDWLHADVGS